MLCNLLVIRRKIRSWVSIHNPIVNNLDIAKFFNQYDYGWIIHLTLPFFLYACISPASIDRNIAVKDILQTRPRWMHEREVMLTILHYWPLTWLQQPNTIEYRGNMSVSQPDIAHTEIYISAQSITNSVWTHSTQPSLSRSQIFPVLLILNDAPIILSHVVASNAQTFTHNYHFQRVICRGTCFHSGYQCSMWPAPRVS